MQKERRYVESMALPTPAPDLETTEYTSQMTANGEITVSTILMTGPIASTAARNNHDNIMTALNTTHKALTPVRNNKEITVSTIVTTDPIAPTGTEKPRLGTISFTVTASSFIHHPWSRTYPPYAAGARTMCKIDLETKDWFCPVDLGAQCYKEHGGYNRRWCYLPVNGQTHSLTTYTGPFLSPTAPAVACFFDWKFANWHCPLDRAEICHREKGRNGQWCYVPADEDPSSSDDSD